MDESLKCARAAIAYVDNDVQYVGFIPVIVAKCGSFLKDQGKIRTPTNSQLVLLMLYVVLLGLYTEGVFRMSGR